MIKAVTLGCGGVGGSQTNYTLNGLRIGGTTGEASDTRVAHPDVWVTHILS